ncbi:MAG TPA: PfkB family carbohydrate kinase, partial [Candidatus Cloacimonadota bacterium]|nr:PfkB family carbohydrate kinase [Candidatus Cloacimonadota bacterium]
FFVPAYPLALVKDPTGAGDSFAGAFMAYLENCASLDMESIKDALLYGTVMAARNVGEFGVQGLLNLERKDIETMRMDMLKWTR